MAYNESSDSEFDQEMERILSEHFDSEDPALRTPNDPWPLLESRMEEPEPQSFFSRVMGRMNPMRDGQLSPRIRHCKPGRGNSCRCSRGVGRGRKRRAGSDGWHSGRPGNGGPGRGRHVNGGPTTVYQRPCLGTKRTGAIRPGWR